MADKFGRSRNICIWIFYFFADKFKMDGVLEIEIHDLKEQGDHDVAAHLKLWSGDLAQTIKTAAKTGKLNDWLVSMAAGTSYSLWKEIYGV